MMDWMNSLAPWHWLVLGVLLLGAEALGAGGFLLGAALASLLVSVVLWIWWDFTWTSQFMLFALATLVFTVGYWRVFRRYNQKTEQPLLNDRAAQLIGRRVQLSEPLVSGEGKLQIGDTLWRVRTDKQIAAGDWVEVKSTDGMTLIVGLTDE